MVGETVMAPIALAPMSRRLAPLVVLLLVLAACSSSGEPTGFDQQPVPVGDELGAALDVDGDTTLPVVQKNFLEGCVLATTPRIVGASDLVASCECTYDELVAFYVDFAENEGVTDVGAVAYDRFKQLDNDLEDPLVPIPANIQTIIDGCVR